MIWTKSQIINYFDNITSNSYFQVWEFLKPRSMNENKYYHWVVVKLISHFSWDTPASVHRYLKKEFYIGSTTNLSTKDFEILMDEIRWWAFSFLWISIPEPNTMEAIQIYEMLSKEKLCI